MALLKRELYRQVKGPEITRADRCTLVFDTDSKKLYVERESAHLEANIGGAVDYQTATMDIAGGCPAFLLKMAKRSLPLVRLRGLHFVRKSAVVWC